MGYFVQKLGVEEGPKYLTCYNEAIYISWEWYGNLADMLESEYEVLFDAK